MLDRYTTGLLWNLDLRSFIMLLGTRKKLIRDTMKSLIHDVFIVLFSRFTDTVNSYAQT